MSLAGIILALGDMVDSACVLVENAHKKIESAEARRWYAEQALQHGWSLSLLCSQIDARAHGRR